MKEEDEECVTFSLEFIYLLLEHPSKESAILRRLDVMEFVVGSWLKFRKQYSTRCIESIRREINCIYYCSC